MIDLAPLLRGARGDELRVAGIAVGDAAAAIDRAQLTGAEETAPAEPRTYANGTVYRGVAGALVEVALAERVEATIRGGGTLRVGEIACAVQDGIVERIFVRGPSLASLGIAAAADIAARFGAADGEELSYGDRLHHYVARRVSIVWDNRERRLSYVALGDIRWVEPRLGARELLAELLAAYDGLEADDWAEPPDGAIRVRYLRIAALARALGIASPAALVEGAFLGDDAARRSILADLAARASIDRPVDGSSAPMVYQQLLGYRHDVERVVRATAGWLECSDAALFGMIATQNAIAAQLTALIGADVDRWLCGLIDPDGRSFTLRELIAHHGWPDVDVHELERDEL